MRVRTAVLTGVNAPFQIADVDLAPPQRGEVLVKIAASGLCGSDLNAISGKRKLVPFPPFSGMKHRASSRNADLMWSGSGQGIRWSCPSFRLAEAAVLALWVSRTIARSRKKPWPSARCSTAPGGSAPTAGN